MRSTPTRRRPDQHEDRAAPRPRWAARVVLALAGAAVVAGLVGVYLGQRGRGRSFTLTGAGVLAAAVVVGFWQARALLRGNDKRPRIRPGEGLSNHILALQEALASAPTRHASKIDAHDGRVHSVAVSADGRTALSGGADRAVRLWDLASGFALREYAGLDSSVAAVALSPDGRLAAACGQGAYAERGKPHGLVLVWDAESGRELRRFETDAVLSSLAFTPDSGRLLIGGTDYLRVWDLESAELLAMISVSRLPGAATILSVAPSPDGKQALCGCRGSQEARLIDLQSGECLRKFNGHRAWMRSAVTGVAFSSDGGRVLTGGIDKTARVHDADSGEQSALFRGHRCWGWRGVVGVAFLPGGKRAVSAGEDGTVRLWSVKKVEQKERYDHGACVSCLAVSADGRVAVSGGSDGVLRTWELPS
jgi:WD40 repeat protein